MSLPDLDFSTFKLFVNWFFTGQITVSNLRAVGSVLKMMLVYKLADYLIAEKFQNAIIDTLVVCMKENDANFSLYHLRKLYRFGLHHTPLYRLALKPAVRRFMLPPELYTGDDRDGLSRIKRNTEMMFDVLKHVSEYN